MIRMAEAETDGLVPSELLPRCQVCGGLMEPNLPEGNAFFTTEHWREQQAAYQSFLKKYHNKKLVILEFGIGWRNQMIKAPLMQLTAAEPNATYITFNKGEIYIPKEIESKAIGVDEDIAKAIEEILKVQL